MIPIIDKVDKKATRRLMKKHLKSLSKNVYKASILDYITIGSSICEGFGNGGIPQSVKYNNAMEKAEQKNREIQEYLQWLMLGINSLEKKYYDVIMGKYFYLYDDDEFEKAMNCSIRTIRTYLAEAEIELAENLKCSILKKEFRLNI